MIDLIDDSTYARMLVSKNRGHGAHTRSLGDIAAEDDAAEYNINSPWIGTSQSRPIEYRETDDFLREEMGYRVFFENDRFDRNDKKDRVLNRYSSEAVQDKLRKTRNNYTEDEILSSVSKITGSCDLRKTTVKNIPLLKEVHGNLTLDASSPLESLDSLKYAGRITVIAKNKEEMNAYLKKLGIINNNGLANFDRRDVGGDNKSGIHFIMKSYI